MQALIQALGIEKEPVSSARPFRGDFPRTGSFPDTMSELRLSARHRAGAREGTVYAGVGRENE